MKFLMLLTFLLSLTYALRVNTCTDRKNYRYIFKNEWMNKGLHRMAATIQPMFRGTLVNWKITIMFRQPLAENIIVAFANTRRNTRGKSTVVLTPKLNNGKVRHYKSFQVWYAVSFKGHLASKYPRCIKICGTIQETGHNLCSDEAKRYEQCDATHYRIQSFRPLRGYYQAKITVKVPTDVVGWRVAFQPRDTCDQINTRFKYYTRGKYIVIYDNHFKHAGQHLHLQYICKFTKVTQNPQISSLIFFANNVAFKTVCGKPLLTISTTKTTKIKTVRKTTVKTTALTKIPNICNPKYNYSDVLQKSILFYEAQRSGKLPPDQRVKWRKDSALKDGADVGKDLTGGYYDAGDYVKFGFPMASAITLLAWGMIEFPDGYKTINQAKYGLKTLKWATDYFIKCHTAKYEFYAQVGDPQLDHEVWGRPEDMSMKRPAFKIDPSKPGSEVAAETAAALAATSMVFRYHGDTRYAKELLKHAVELEEFGTRYRKLYHISIPEVKSFYKSHNGYRDELAWAKLWLYRATSDRSYYEAFIKEFKKEALASDVNEFSWDDKWAGVKVLATFITKDEKYLEKLKELLEKPKKTAKGLFFVSQWGSNRHAANLAFLALVASRLKDADFYESFARQQIHYILGDTGRSFVVGFGKNPPLRPHHASSSCPDTRACDWNNFKDPKPNTHVLYGALVGGPDKDDWYKDNRMDIIRNEVACDYNAGFQSAIAGLMQLSKLGKC